MKSRPILFSGAMIRAILGGSKTQTRRVLKGMALDWISTPTGFDPQFIADAGNRLCPYGQTGDQLWVRETWGARFSHADFGGVALHWNDLRGPLKKYRTHQNLALYAMSANGQYCGGWIPSIHMPRWASRITLEITGVRVETLGIISHEDALAEGVSSIEEYKALWININGAWLPETWVWVVDFRMVLN